ncbi:MAG TPA: LamG-like jellyroll fold domain-containing protein, partial [Pseudonocardiaceae bacterium]|nr:LamG-like jellyroll fold domain-containing protein [Pseudonocardiaceae bacterium]
SGAGWVLAVGDFGRGIPRNVRFTLGDGTRTVEVFADTSLPTDAFTHLAGVLDRAAGQALLYVNGVPSLPQPLAGLGAIVNTAPLRIGAGAGGFRGAIDEVRISSVARGSFAPALGEEDEHYRRRLRLFRRWSLPTPGNLGAMLNELVGPINGTQEALIVDDTNATLVRGTRLVRIRPVSLRAGESINAAGQRRVSETESVGTAADEDTFDPAFLLRYDRADVDFIPAPVRDLQPGEPPPDPHLVQVGVADRLDRLVALAGAETSPPGRLLIGTAFDPRAADLRATGRAVMLGHSSVPPGRLAALAHRAGFDFVRFRGSGSAQVYAAAALGDYFSIELNSGSPAPPAGLSDVDSGATVALSLRPQPPQDAFVRWLTVPGGKGRGILTPDGAPGTRQQTASLRATAAGQLIVKADVTRNRRTVSATRRLRIGITELGDKRSIAADGTLDAPATVVDVPDTFFHPAFLIRHNDPRVDYGGAEDHRRMQPAVGEVLDSLLDELTRRGVSGQLVITAAFDPSGDPAVDAAAVQGRRLVLRHTVLTPESLAGTAFAAGFGHVTRDGDDVIVRQRPGQLVAVRGPSDVDTGPIIEVDEGTGLEVTASPEPSVLIAAGLTGPPPSNEPRLAWASDTFDEAGIALGSSTQQVNRLIAGAAGMAWIQASYLLGPALPPFTFQVRLRPELDTPETVISKDQFDLIMNILNALHPVGVEVFTSA